MYLNFLEMVQWRILMNIVISFLGVELPTLEET